MKTFETVFLVYLYIDTVAANLLILLVLFDYWIFHNRS